MHRESDTHGPRQDDELKHELSGMLRGNGPTHAQEWREVEPTDDPADPADSGDSDDTDTDTDTEPAGGEPMPPE